VKNEEESRTSSAGRMKMMGLWEVAGKTMTTGLWMGV
jgi:hypothetical protein